MFALSVQNRNEGRICCVDVSLLGSNSTAQHRNESLTTNNVLLAQMKSNGGRFPESRLQKKRLGRVILNESEASRGVR